MHGHEGKVAKLTGQIHEDPWHRMPFCGACFSITTSGTLWHEQFNR